MIESGSGFWGGSLGKVMSRSFMGFGIRIRAAAKSPGRDRYRLDSVAGSKKFAAPCRTPTGGGNQAVSIGLRSQNVPAGFQLVSSDERSQNWY